MSVPNNANTYLPGVICIPSALQITAIAQTNPMLITYIVNPSVASFSYQQGQVVKLNVPKSYGMFQANGLMARIVSTSTSTISVNVDATRFDPFVIPSSGAEQPASFAPAGSQNLQYNNSTNTVPFQSLNNIGN
jgi:hypothetical protein